MESEIEYVGVVESDEEEELSGEHINTNENENETENSKFRKVNESHDTHDIKKNVLSSDSNEISTSLENNVVNHQEQQQQQQQQQQPQNHASMIMIPNNPSNGYFASSHPPPLPPPSCNVPILPHSIASSNSIPFMHFQQQQQQQPHQYLNSNILLKQGSKSHPYFPKYNSYIPKHSNQELIYSTIQLENETIQKQEGKQQQFKNSTKYKKIERLPIWNNNYLYSNDPNNIFFLNNLNNKNITFGSSLRFSDGYIPNLGGLRCLQDLKMYKPDILNSERNMDAAHLYANLFISKFDYFKWIQLTINWKTKDMKGKTKIYPTYLSYLNVREDLKINFEFLIKTLQKLLFTTISLNERKKYEKCNKGLHLGEKNLAPFITVAEFWNISNLIPGQTIYLRYHPGVALLEMVIDPKFIILPS